MEQSCGSDFTRSNEITIASVFAVCLHAGAMTVQSSLVLRSILLHAYFTLGDVASAVPVEARLVLFAVLMVSSVSILTACTGRDKPCEAKRSQDNKGQSFHSELLPLGTL